MNRVCLVPFALRRRIGLWPNAPTLPTEQSLIPSRPGVHSVKLPARSFLALGRTDVGAFRPQFGKSTSGRASAPKIVALRHDLPEARDLHQRAASLPFVVRVGSKTTMDVLHPRSEHGRASRRRSYRDAPSARRGALLADNRAARRLKTRSQASKKPLAYKDFSE